MFSGNESTRRMECWIAASLRFSLVTSNYALRLITVQAFITNAYSQPLFIGNASLL
jgi:hypothetical protein